MLWCSILSVSLQAQVKWLSFQELDSVLMKEPKSTLVFLEADWCVYCKKMQKEVFSSKKVQSLIDENYHAVLLDIEDDKVYQFDGQTFVKASGNKYHQLAYLFAEPGSEPISPTLAILSKDLEFLAIYRTYLSKNDLLKFIRSLQ